jgi:hypothetical protein
VTTELDTFLLEAPPKQTPRSAVGFWAGGVMLLTAATLWIAAYAQLRFLSPPIAKLLSSNLVKVSERQKLDGFWNFPWRGTGSGTARLAALAAVASAIICVSVRTWWAWGATLVAAPLAANWYITFFLFMPALVIVDKMKL